MLKLATKLIEKCFAFVSYTFETIQPFETSFIVTPFKGSSSSKILNY